MKKPVGVGRVVDTTTPSASTGITSCNVEGVASVVTVTVVTVIVGGVGNVPPPRVVGGAGGCVVVGAMVVVGIVPCPPPVVVVIDEVVVEVVVVVWQQHVLPMPTISPGTVQLPKLPIDTPPLGHRFTSGTIAYSLQYP